MSSNNILTSGIQDNNDVTIEPPSFIEITKNTVRFGSKVYQFRNVTGFGLAEVKNKNFFPSGLIFIGFIFGLSLITFTDSKFFGLLIVAAAVGGIIANNSQPKLYGFQLELNSGTNKVFITSDLDGVRRVVSVLYDFMENGVEGSYVINIDQSRASIGVGYAEQFNAKNVGGSIHNNDD